jgi:fimbrial chaperone protein
MKAGAIQCGIASTLLSLTAAAGSLQVGPIRVDLSPRHPVGVVEVLNTGDAATLTQIDTLVWSQNGGEESLDPTPDLIVTPLIFSLEPGQAQKLRIGLRESSPAGAERSYRIVIAEVNQPTAPSSGVHFAVRISIPIFATGGDFGAAPVIKTPVLTWSARPGEPGCERIVVANDSERHDHIMHAELLGVNSEVLWQSDASDYVLAGAQRTLHPQVCLPVTTRAAQLRLTTEGRTLILQPSAAGMLVDAK